MLDTVKEPVQFCCPRTAIGFEQLILKVLQGFFFVLLHSQGFAQVSDVVDGLENIAQN